jgi:hypothetical protein
MDRQHVGIPATHLHVALRVTGIAVGGLLWLSTFVMLMRIAWDHDRMAILEDYSMMLSLPLVVAGFSMWTAGLVLLAIGQWPPRGTLLTAFKSGGALALSLILAWMIVTGGTSQESRYFAPILGLSILVIAYIGIGAVVQRWWLLVVMPTMTAPIVFIMAAWVQLATGNRVHGGAELEMAGAFLGILVWGILVPAAIVLTGFGLVIGDAVTRRWDR